MCSLSTERRARPQCKYAHTASVPDNEGPILHEWRGRGAAGHRPPSRAIGYLLFIIRLLVCSVDLTRGCRHLCNRGRLRLFRQSKSASSTDSQPAEERQGPSGGYSSQGGAEAKRRRCDDKEPLAPHSYVSGSQDTSVQSRP